MLIRHVFWFSAVFGVACGGKVVFDGPPQGSGGAGGASVSQTATATGVGAGTSGCTASADCPGVDCGDGVVLHVCANGACLTDPAVVCGTSSVAVGAGVGGGSTGCALGCAEAITDPCPMLCNPSPIAAALAQCAANFCASECATTTCLGTDPTCGFCVQMKCPMEFTSCANDI